MERLSKDELLHWVKDYRYNESEKGIGTCDVKISVRDEAERLKLTFDVMEQAEKKEIMCILIDKVGYPCEDYADDFDDEDSPFGFSCEWDEYNSSMRFSATFRTC